MSSNRNAEIDPNREVGQRVQEKFDFYVVGLAFTVLGLAIQTAKFGVWKWADVMELVGWLSLFISGVAGLRRLALIPGFFHVAAFENEHRDSAAELKTMRAQPGATFRSLTTLQPISADPLIEAHEKAATNAQENLDKFNRKFRTQSRIQRQALVVGLGLLMLARAAIPVRHLIAVF
jgi:erythromycin esterase-like protein